MKKPTPLALLAIVAMLPIGPAFADGVDGKKLYDTKCAMCHGKDGVAKAMGVGSANFNDAEWKKANPLEKIIRETAEGTPDTKMQGYKNKLSEAEIKAISEYIKAL